MLESGKVEFFAELRVRRRPHRRLAHLRRAVRGARALPDRRRPLPRARHPGGDAAAVRGRRRRPGDPGQRPGPARGGAEPVRRRRIGQDRDRRLRLAAGARRGPRRDLLGAAARPVDAQPGGDPARSGGLPRHGRRHDAGGRGGGLAGGPLPPAGGRRHHAAHRPVGHADDGQDPHPGHVGARAAAHASSTSYDAGTSSAVDRGGSRSPTDRSRSPTTRSSCTARRTA